MVCDDGSTDGTVGILEEYARIHGLHYQVNPCNLGYIKNFEKTISLCSGDYIALCDQDDRWQPGKLEILADKIGDHSLICSDAALIDGSGNKIAGSFRRYSRIHVPSRGKQTHSLTFHNYVVGCTSLFHRSDFISPLYPFPDNIPHDWWIAIITSMRNGIKYINKPLIEYRLHGKNASSTVRKGLLDDICNYRKKFNTKQNHLDTVMTIKFTLLLLNELENRGLIDPWMISLKHDLQALLDDYDISPLKHPKANLIILKYLNYFCPSPNPIVKIMFMIENIYDKLTLSEREELFNSIQRRNK
jgi:glycosyltransferase involved in cell wall biosynthesis